VNLTLVGDSILKSGTNRAGLEVPDGSNVTIDGIGSLEAIGASQAAGIGGANADYYKGTGGNITVNDGTITANGGAQGAGIGGGYYGHGGNIIINGGIITANGGVIGGGYRRWLWLWCLWRQCTYLWRKYAGNSDKRGRYGIAAGYRQG